MAISFILYLNVLLDIPLNMAFINWILQKICVQRNVVIET